MVSSQRQLVGVPPSHDRGLVQIHGAETFNWGCGAIEQNSLLGALEAVCRLLKFPGVDYAALMGVSGHAFRIQVTVDGLCPSSPNPYQGSSTAERAFQAVPLDWTTIQAGLASTAQADEATKQVRAAVDNGLPVLAIGEEVDLVLGHFHDHLVGRTYDGGEEGYASLSKWPWTFQVPERIRTAPPPAVQIRDGLQSAITNWELAEPVNGCWSGAAAYAAWRDKLTEANVLSLETDVRWQFQHANGFIMECLLDARRCAAAFLLRVSNTLGPQAKPHLLAASETYRHLAEEALGATCLKDLAPYPWMCDADHVWDETIRLRQIEHLHEAEGRDREAIEHIKQALLAEG